MSLLGGVLNAETVSGYTPAKRRLAGTVMVDSVGAARMVVVFDRSTMGYIGATISSTDGSWEIKGMPALASRGLLAVALDTAGVYNAEALDLLTQVE